MKSYFLSIALVQVCGLLHAQPTVPNPGFEQSDTASSTQAYGWHSGGNGGRITTDTRDARRGKASVHLSVPASGGSAIFYTDELPIACNGLKKYRLTCALKTEGIQGQAGVRVKVFDDTGYQIAGNNLITLTTNRQWHKASGEFYADASAKKMVVLGLLAGPGDLWIDDIKIREIPLDGGLVTYSTREYLKEYFSVVRRAWVGRSDTVKIAEVERRAKALCGGNPSLAYCRGILQRYITYALDYHSNYATPAEWKAMNEVNDVLPQTGETPFATGRMLRGQTAYIHVPTFYGFDEGLIHQAVDSLQHIIRLLDAQEPHGWIVDVSENGGGNSFAMLPGLGPLLGNGVCGRSVSADSSFKELFYRDGSAGWDSTVEFKQRSAPYYLKKEGRPIAVIQGPGTVSSGEVVAMAFRGMPATKSFGQPTAGATTRVDNFVLSDGACLFLAAGYNGDRSGVVYKSAVPPDVPAQDTVQAIEMAIDWIAQQAVPSAAK